MGKHRDITKDQSRAWPRKRRRMDQHIPDNGYTTDGPFRYVARRRYRGSIREINDEIQIAIFSDKDPEKIITMLELEKMSEEGSGIYAYAQETDRGIIMVADISDDSYGLGEIYRSNDMYLKDVNEYEHEKCIMRTLLEAMHHSVYTKKLTQKIDLPEQSPGTRRTRILL